MSFMVQYLIGILCYLASAAVLTVPSNHQTRQEEAPFLPLKMPPSKVVFPQNCLVFCFI